MIFGANATDKSLIYRREVTDAIIENQQSNTLANPKSNPNTFASQRHHANDSARETAADLHRMRIRIVNTPMIG